jgi:hypothetical protein
VRIAARKREREREKLFQTAALAAALLLVGIRFAGRNHSLSNA